MSFISDAPVCKSTVPIRAVDSNLRSDYITVSQPSEERKAPSDQSIQKDTGLTKPIMSRFVRALAGKSSITPARGSSGTTMKRMRKCKEHTWNTTSQTLPNRLRPKADTKVYSFNQEVLYNNVLTTSTSVPSFASLSFKLSDLDLVSSYTTIFDQYRIALIEAWVIPDNPGANVAGEIASVVDHDDTSNLTSLASALDYQSCLVDKPQGGHYRCFVPHCASALYSGSFTSYGNVTSPWIDCGSTSVQHYGIKLAATAVGASSYYDVLVRYHVEFKNVR
jgi:hypothetical protein